MSKLIAGFLLGVVVTLTVVYLLNDRTAPLPAVLPDQPSAPEAITRAPQIATVEKVQETVKDINDEPKSSARPELAANVEPVPLPDQSGVVPQPDSNPNDPPSNTPTKTVNKDYPPEIADMIEKRVDKDLQSRYESDEREESWATYMEGQLAAYFAQKPTLAQFYVSLIDCRTSICEIHVLGYGPDALTQWNTATADIVSQPWFEFNSMSMNRYNPEPDILAIVLIVSKKPPG